jgi:hypothetical protein
MKRKELWLLALILLLGGCARLFHIDTMFLNSDEPLHQVRISYQPLAFVLRYNNGPLFSLLAHFLLPLGPLELMVRAVPFASGMLTIVLSFLLGRALFSKAAGLIAALLTACSHLLIFYSQNGRTYALTTVLFLAAALFLVRAVGSGRRRPWILYALALCLCLYTHTVAFLALPPFALFAAFVWWEQSRKNRAAAEPEGRRTAGRFLLWTGSALVTAVLLYLPCAWMVDMFKGSMLLGIEGSRPSGGLTLRAAFEILQVEISPLSGAIFILTLLLAVAGCLGWPGSRRRGVLLIGASVVFPWLVFLLGSPRENDVTSLYRYLQHLLPLIFILAARGILHLASGLETLVRRSHPRGRAVPIAVSIVLSVVLGAGFLSNLGGYQYTDFWRQGSYRFDAETRAVLRERVDRDALLYIDSFPVATELVLMNPLSKDQSFEGNENAAREDFVRSLPSAPVMIMAIDWAYFRDYVASRKIELWAVTPTTPEKTESLRAAAAAAEGFEFVERPKYTLLHFKKDARSLAEKMADLADLLVSWPDGDAVLRRQRLIFAAQSYLLTRNAAETGGAIRAFRGVPVSDREDRENAGTAAERALGGLFGYGPKALREFFEGRSFAEIDNLLLAYGRNMVDSGNLPEARSSLELFVNGEGADRGRAIEPLIALGDRFEKSGQTAQALQAWETAARLSPGREDIASRIARIRGKVPDPS